MRGWVCGGWELAARARTLTRARRADSPNAKVEAKSISPRPALFSPIALSANSPPPPPPQPPLSPEFQKWSVWERGMLFSADHPCVRSCVCERECGRLTSFSAPCTYGKRDSLDSKFYYTAAFFCWLWTQRVKVASDWLHQFFRRGQFHPIQLWTLLWHVKQMIAPSYRSKLGRSKFLPLTKWNCCNPLRINCV